MLRTCASTVLRVTKSSCAIPRSVLPCGDQREHLALARRERRERVSRGGSATSSLDERRLDDGAARGDPLERGDELADVGDPVLEQVADPLRTTPSRASARSRPRRTARAPACRPAGASGRISCAASSPSFVYVGGMRMSMTATSGGSAATSRSSSSRGARLGRDLDAVLGEQPREALADDDGVVGEDHAHGIAAVTRVPPAGGALDLAAGRRAPRRGRGGRAARRRRRRLRRCRRRRPRSRRARSCG